MIHIDTVKKFLEYLPDPTEMRGATKTFTLKKEWDTKSSYIQKNVSVTFRSTQTMDTWKWVYIGEIII